MSTTPAGTVLVVDDEGMVRTVATAILRQAGYAVVEAGDPDAAVEAFRRANRVDVVVLDLTLPGRSGAAVLAELRAIDPEIRVLISSGDEPDPALLVGPTGYLPKPFNVRSLLAAVRRLRGEEEP